MLPFINECSLFRIGCCFRNKWPCFNYVNIQFAPLTAAKRTVLSYHVISAHPSAVTDGWIQPPNFRLLCNCSQVTKECWYSLTLELLVENQLTFTEKITDYILIQFQNSGNFFFSPNFLCFHSIKMKLKWNITEESAVLLMILTSAILNLAKKLQSCSLCTSNCRIPHIILFF